MKITLKKLIARYGANEENNCHTENVVLLTSFFGTREDYAIAKGFQKTHETLGELPKNEKLREIFHEIQSRMYSEYLKAQVRGAYEVVQLHN